MGKGRGYCEFGGQITRHLYFESGDFEKCRMFGLSGVWISASVLFKFLWFFFSFFADDDSVCWVKFEKTAGQPLL